MKKFFYILILMISAVGLANTNLLVDRMSVGVETFDKGADPIKEKVVVSPNPATTYTLIKSTTVDNNIVEVSVFSLLGNKLFSKAYSGNEQSIQLNVQNFKKGKYLIKVGFSDGTAEVKALIKQ